MVSCQVRFAVQSDKWVPTIRRKVLIAWYNQKKKKKKIEIWVTWMVLKTTSHKLNVYVSSTLMPCRSLSPTLRNRMFFSRFVEYTVMTFDEGRGPSVVIYTFSMQYICNVNKSAWVLYIYVIYLTIHISFVSIGYSQLIFSRNWQLRKFDGRSLKVCCLLVEDRFCIFWVTYVIMLTIIVFFWHMSCLWVAC